MATAVVLCMLAWLNTSSCTVPPLHAPWFLRSSSDAVLFLFGQNTEYSLLPVWFLFSSGTEWRFVPVWFQQ
jgi:hypothetical protein